MRLATRALIAALATLVLCTAVSAQTLRRPTDPRNQAPTVGTGGGPGGPTGLFTIYDGDTLRRGEFTFSIAYSNYDRDPGDVDITEVPVSFNLGINDHLELFFNTDAYRGIKVNDSKNLSGFYLPNSQLFFGATLLCTGPAIILPPERVSGSTALTGFSPLFRPAGPPCNVGGQGFVQFPFVGATGPNFGLTGNAIAPPFVSRLGVPTGGGSTYGAASNFPGIGSVVGSILPGIVLTTRVQPPTPTTLSITVPDLFTISPSYLPDAPFVNRLYGESAFSTSTIGANIRFTGPNNPLSLNLIPFYRFYWDKADDAAGFNQLQRGASPGGSLGDFGLTGVVGGRLSRSVHLAANFTYILNSNPKSEAFGGADDVTLLDRPDEFITGIGFDFPVNRFFQPIVEVKSTFYVGGRTPNAFENNPFDLLGGIRIYPRRWFGFSAAYRLHVNPQGDKLFGGSSDFPAGFRQSEDPHGFLGQFWIGHRNARIPPHVNTPPVVSVSASSATIFLPCVEGRNTGTCVPSASREIQLTAQATDVDNDTLLYTWSVTGGRVTGEGRAVTWDLSGANPGTYTATVEVNDGNQGTANANAAVTLEVCVCPPPPCPNISVSCPSDVDEGQPLSFNASVTGTPDLVPTYNWSVSAGTITSGQGTSSITVDTAGLGGQSVTATVEVGGVEPACGRTGSCSTSVKPVVKPVPVKFDEYGDIKFNDEKARLDNYAIQLQNQTGSQGYIIAYGTCEGEGQARADRAKNYLVNTRGIEAGRVTAVDGGCRADLTVQLWIVPTGAENPAASSDGAVSPCPECKRAPRRRGRRD